MADWDPEANELFLRAIEIHGAEERRRFLNECCAGNATLRERVDKLLRAGAEAGSFLERPAEGLEGTSAFASKSPNERTAEISGMVIGPYKFIEQIGEGGMGTVWMAQQVEPVKRLVALKLIKPGMDSKHVLARFNAERQALALMDHPNIAKVFDAGTTETGWPYFVMELVKGLPLTKYCDEHRLTPKQRLELFIPICQAIQHAHQKGIIHRDIKPSNVLVALYDGKPVPKVIDFGVAKALGQQLTEQTLVTGFGNIVGTLEYMSPEQAEMNQLDIDTRSDIYSLGVLLYELLTGSTPLDKKRLKEAAFVELLRVIREEEPHSPSTRLSASKDSLASISARRQMEPTKLTKLVRGELDWIVMKALEKDRNRRYETANGFAMDVQRYLADEPVQACPPSARYRLRKFARRNQRALAATALVAVLLVVAVGAVTGSLVWRARDRATMQEETERGLLAALVQAEAYLRETSEQLDDPVRWQMTVGLADGAVERAERLLVTSKVGPELVERVRGARAALEVQRQDSDLLVALERFQLEMGDWIVEARQGHDESRAAPRYATLLQSYGVDPATPAAAAARVRNSRLREPLLAALEHWRRVTPDAAERQQLELVLQAAEPRATAFQQRWSAAVRRRDAAALAQLVGEPSVQQLPVQAILNLARDLRAARELVAAERLLRTWHERYPGNFWLNRDLGALLLYEKPARPGEAIRYLTAALAIRSESPGVYQNLGNALRNTRDVDGAIRAFQAALKLDPNYASAHVSLGAALFDTSDVAGASREYQIALKLDPNDAIAHNNLGIIAMQKQNVDDAIREFQTALKIQPKYALAHYDLGVALNMKSDLAGTIREFQTALECDPSLIDVHVNLGLALDLYQHDMAGAKRAFEAALKLDPNCARAHFGLGRVLPANDWKGLEGRLLEFQTAVQLNPNDAEAQFHLGMTLNALHRYAEALPALEVADRLGAQRPGWRYPPEMLYRMKRSCELNVKLASVLMGQSEPANVGERLQLAGFCLEDRQLFVTAAAWYAEVFAAEPAAADDMKAGHRYNAACAAALAGNGLGRDAIKLKEDERTRLRKQALDWLRADLATYAEVLASNQPNNQGAVKQRLEHWRKDNDLASIRDVAQLDRLPAPEREECMKLWTDVDNLLKKTTKTEK
jgi:serine/threonine protein kinase/tetratricopeptide (TPR) repeat protein